MEIFFVWKFFLCGNFFYKKKLHKVVWKKYFKKNPHNFVDTPNRGCPKSKKSTHSLSLQRKEEFHNQYYVIWPVRAELLGLPLID
ncbi:hypothetical protein BWG23_14945 [Flavobacterium oreochromis]|nr:hypothetical protein BWG23_14945 [Flavobacterium oreochromis]